MNSMQNSLTATVAVAAFATGLAAPASAQTQTAFTNNPITIEGFTAYTQFTPIETESLGIDAGPASSDVTIAFINTANVPAKSVTFAVRSGRQTKIVVDKGTFSPGVRIVHTFDESPQFDNTSSVSIVGVSFANGSTWGT